MSARARRSARCAYIHHHYLLLRTRSPLSYSYSSS